MSETAVDRRRMSDFENTIAAMRERMHASSGEAAVAARVVYAAVAAYAVVFAVAAVLHYEVFGMARFDLGNMVQAIWNTLHGHVLETTRLGGGQGSRLGYHVDPFLVLLTPLAWLSSMPQILLALQAIAVASGALPVFWLARKHLDSARGAALFAVAYLLYPATQFNADTPGDGFHAVSLAVPLILFAIWFLDEERLVAFSVAALLAASTKEEIPLAVGCLGIWYAVRKGNRAFGFSVFAVGLGLTLVNFLWVIPRFAPRGVDPFAGRYTGVGGTPHGMLHKLFSDPAAFVHAVASGHKVGFVLLFLPLLFLSLLEPLLLLGAVPDLVINLLSANPNQTTVQFQYTAGIVPFVFAAAVFGAARLRHRRNLDLPLWVCAASAAVAIYSPMISAVSDVSALGSASVAAQEHAVALIPSGVPVAASNQIGGHLSARRVVYSFPTVRHARWIVVDVNDETYADTRGYRSVVREYERNKAWRTVYSSDGVRVLRSSTSRN